jgi:putative transposase
MPGPRPQLIVLTDRQREMLVHLTRCTNSTQGLVRRARIVLTAAEDLNNEQLARELGIDRQTARLWRGKWLAAKERLEEAEEEASSSEKVLRECIEDVLSDAPRGGTPATFTPEQICRIVALALEEPGDCGRSVTHWTNAELADEAVKRDIVQSISPRSVGRFLGRGGFEAASGTLLAQQ